jgi:hypothetical protein
VAKEDHTRSLDVELTQMDKLAAVFFRSLSRDPVEAQQERAEPARLKDQIGKTSYRWEQALRLRCTRDVRVGRS